MDNDFNIVDPFEEKKGLNSFNAITINLYLLFEFSRYIIIVFMFLGITGVLLFVVMTIIFVFAHPTIRKKAYKFFWSTHSLYVVLYILCLIHGLARLTGPPRFWYFFIGPATIYILDKVINYCYILLLVTA